MRKPIPENSNPSTQSRLSTKNYILNALPEEDFNRLLPDLTPVKLPHGQILYRPDEPIEYVYFPNNSVISVVAITADGQSVESGVIGREGMAGVNVLMGVDSMPNENIIQLADGALRMSTAAVRREFKRGGALHDLLLRFMHALMIQIGQTTLCNRLHSTDQRLSRWLLICHDRSETDEMKLTQEFLAIMLGADRARVTMSAIALQSTGYIKYSRGNIVVTDREGLEDFTCACYQSVKQEYDRFQKQ
ncbi:MAG: Crp/Fnr family transcriptional regulator [Acidobacteria bacterium]|jgi:CRP-like cAMP-binding protein|nr:Crp/Fnr family transcriptional regulator [Acidobacteriota bacterium]